jgi:choline dehydrogenase-like flavoprotein
VTGGNAEGRPDVVIVGAGSAGAVLAARLAEDPDRRVLLLEAGPDHTSAETPPSIRGLNFIAALGEPGRLWPDLLATRTSGQVPSLYPRGRGVGGSSAVNGLVALRGTPEDYDRWAGPLGCPGWGWSDLLPRFLQVEDDVDYGGDGLHGRGGPIPLARIPPDELGPLDGALRAALADSGQPVEDDYHAPGATGISRVALTVRDGQRVSTNDAYLEPARANPNLTIRGDTLVDRIRLDGDRAVGVVTARGEQIDAGEVIVSAGAIHSPAILLRSGIGPVSGLPVGANLVDHPATPGFELALTPAGRLPPGDVSVVTSMVRYSSGLDDAGDNDMQILWLGTVSGSAEDHSGGRVLVAAMRSFSRGEVRLASSDPSVDPVVEFGMLADMRDLVRLREATYRVIDILRHPAVGAIVESIDAAGTPLASLRSDAAVDAWLKSSVNDYVHAAGTCRMGSPGDPNAVVDLECRVIGSEGLRVCDASVMPDVPRANTHLTTVAIAEAVADLVRGR